MILRDESLDDLGINNFKIFQKKDGFRFGIDAVLLANFTRVKRHDIGIDLCTGTGIIPLLVVAKSNIKKIIGIEIQKEMAILANKSVEYNNLSDKIEILNFDVRNLSDIFSNSTFDFITINPPYYKTNNIISKNDKKNIARHEILLNLEDVFKISSNLLKSKKCLFMIHKPERLVELFLISTKYNLEPKEIQFIHPNTKKEPNLVLIKFVKDGNNGIKYLRPLFVYDDYGNYTCQINELYTKSSIEVS